MYVSAAYDVEPYRSSVVVVVRSKPPRQIGRKQVEDFVSSLFAEELHAKRVASLINGVDRGVIPVEAEDG